MKSLLLLASLMSMAPTAAFAHRHHQVVRETCTAYRRTETYNPGHYDQQGNWVGGGVVQGQVAIPCLSYGNAVPVAHYAHSTVPMPQQQAQPLVVNNQSSAPQQQSCGGVIARMGLGGILGGVAGRYAVGGKKSNHTVLGTTIGAAAGSLIGRATC